MGTNAVKRGATANAVSENVRRLREGQNLGLRALSTKLGEVGRQLTHSAVDQIERGRRRVDVDDLMALAAALDTSPAILLMPVGEEDDEAVATGHQDKLTCGRAWDWITGRRPPRDTAGAGLLGWLARSRPHWTFELTGGTPVVKVSDGDD
jgi:transcriptional regulator with XRE-family HTH domain